MNKIKLFIIPSMMNIPVELNVHNGITIGEVLNDIHIDVNNVQIKVNNIVVDDKYIINSNEVFIITRKIMMI